MTPEQAELILGYYDGLRPVKIIPVSTWSEKNIYLSVGAEPGLYKTARVPFMRKIMESMAPMATYNRVVFMKGVQITGTQSAINAIMCHVDIKPTPIMYVMPTVEMAEFISKDRIAPIIENSEVLSKKILPPRSRDSGNTTSVKRFPGGFIVFAGANSGPSLRSRPVQILILDEVDGYPLSVGTEGSPVSLAEKRTTSFGSRRKIMLLSTPLDKEKSIIEPEYLATDQQKYYVPCPFCKEKQELVFGNLKWEKGKFKSVRYHCEYCRKPIEERYKSWFLSEENGAEWVATKPENTNEEVIGFHLNSLYSPFGWLSWSDLAKEWEKSQQFQEKLKVFINQYLAETWAEAIEVPSWEALFDRREKYQFNKPLKEVVFLTAGVDIQKDRIELEIVGWCKDKRSYSIDYRVLDGDTTSQDVWNRLKDVVNETWLRSDGVIMPLRLMAIDTGYNTQYVYQFCRQFDSNKVIPIKGQEKQMVIVSPPKSIDVNINGKKMGKVRLYNIAVSLLKSELYGYLRQRIDGTTGEIPAGYCYFPEYSEDHFKNLTAEYLKPTRNKWGRMVNEWYLPPGKRNEQLDCRNYARAAASIIGMDRWNDQQWEIVASSYQQKREQPKQPVKKRESSFWGNKEKF